VNYRNTDVIEADNPAAGPRTEADAIAEVARLATEPHILEPGKIHALLTPKGVQILDLDKDEYRDTPRRKTGTIRVEDLDSFAHYYAKHADAGSDIYVDIDRHTITAVIDANQTDGPRWGQHKLVLALKTTDRWKAWAGNDRQPMRQGDFADFIEDHLDDIREPAAAAMLEIAQTFQAQTKVRFKSNIALSSGQRTLNFEETVDAKAGETGQLTVPSTFKIGIAPFDFAEPYAITARFRYRIQSGELVVQYLLDDPAAVIRDAVKDVVEHIQGDLGVTVMRGTPE
jgi:uncharacterized protein YfdQ (DUF2303 family)